MSVVGLEAIDHSVQLTHQWINELNDRLEWNSKGRSYRLLRTVLHGIRDWLLVNEAVDFAAQLPTFLRGVYYEQWRPSTVPVKPRDKAAFVARVDHAFRADPITNTDAAIIATFRFIGSKIGAGEIEDVRKALPADLRELWPEQ